MGVYIHKRFTKDQTEVPKTQLQLTVIFSSGITDEDSSSRKEMGVTFDRHFVDNNLLTKMSLSSL